MVTAVERQIANDLARLDPPLPLLPLLPPPQRVLRACVGVRVRASVRARACGVSWIAVTVVTAVTLIN
jgi:hypothetical protein